MTNNVDYKHVYAIIRIDYFQKDNVSIEDMIAIKKIVWDKKYAESEVDRLNELNSSKDCRYYWRLTRLENPSITTE